MKSQPIQEVTGSVNPSSFPHDVFVNRARSFARNVKLTVEMLSQRGVFTVDELSLAGEIFNNCGDISTLCETYEQEKTAHAQGKGDLSNIDYNELYVLVNDSARNFTPLINGVLAQPKKGIMPAELKPLGDMFETSLHLIQQADHFFSDMAAQKQFQDKILSAYNGIEKN